MEKVICKRLIDDERSESGVEFESVLGFSFHFGRWKEEAGRGNI